MLGQRSYCEAATSGAHNPAFPGPPRPPTLLRTALPPGFSGRDGSVPTGPLGGVERPRRVVRFARLIHRRGRVLGGPRSAPPAAAIPSLTWLRPKVLGQARLGRSNPDRSEPAAAANTQQSDPAHERRRT